MAEYTGGIELEGLAEVLRGFEKADKAVRDAAVEGMERGAMNIIADAQENLRNNGSVASGYLRQSGRVQKGKDSSIEAGFFDTKRTGSGYAKWVEYGRRSGKMPPVEDIAQWLRKKHTGKGNAITSAAAFLHKKREDVILSAAWAIAKYMAKNDTKPRPFLQPALDKNRTKILETVSVTIKENIDGNNGIK